MLSAKALARVIVACFGMALAACGGGGGGDEPGNPTTFTIGGTVTGLTGSGLVLKNNGADALNIATNGAFTFSTPVNTGGSYAVTVSAQPTGQFCNVAAATGTATAVVANVLVACAATTPHTIGGTVTGATGATLLRNNGGNDLTVAADGSFTFSATVAHDAAYAVTVQTPPAGQVCTVANGFGVATANVTNVAITCSTPAAVPHTIGGTVYNLNTSGLVLRNNGGDPLAVAASGTFTFATPLNVGASYSVTVATQPLGQSCSVFSGDSGTVAADVTGVLINCAAIATRTIGGTVSGLAGTVVLQVNGANNLSVSTSGPFTFGTAINNGPYVVKVLTQPAGQVCTVASGGSDNGFGGSASGNVTGVSIRCVTPAGTTYTLGGNLTGMTSSGLVLTLSRNGTLVETLAPLSANLTSFVFATPMSAGDTWVVGTTWQPGNPLTQACQLVGTTGSGTIATANVTSVQVSCANVSAAITGTITMSSGTLAAGLVLLNNGGDALAVPAGATGFQFATTQLVPGSFRVSIKTQPSQQTCTLVNNFGSTFLATQSGGTAIQVKCVNRHTGTPLNGLYSLAVNEAELPDYYLALFTDGTYIFTSREDRPGECSVNSGNGIEYGVYDFNATTSTLTFLVPTLDTNGGCGLIDDPPADRLVTAAAKNATTGVLTGNTPGDSGTLRLRFTPVPSATGQLLGGWFNTKLGFMLFKADNTFVFAIAESSQTVAGGTMEVACFTGALPTASSGTYKYSFASTCMPHGSAVLDTGGPNVGFSALGPSPTTFSVSVDVLSLQTGSVPVIQSRLTVN